MRMLRRHWQAGTTELAELCAAKAQLCAAKAQLCAAKAQLCAAKAQLCKAKLWSGTVTKQDRCR
jgi:outer membrane protein TolC